MPPPEHKSLCLLCGQAMPNDVLAAHLHDEHGLAVPTWPDGEPLVFDETVQPEDFDADA